MNLNKQLELYREKRDTLLDENGVIKSSEDEVFTTIGQIIDMTPRAVQLAVIRHADEIFDGKYVQKSKAPRNVVDEEDDIYEDCNFFDGTYLVFHVRDPKLQFYFDLIDHEGPSKSYTALRSGWTDALFKLIKQETGTPCVINFDRHYLTGVEFRATGVCAECKGTAKVKSTNNRTTMHVQIVEGPLPHTNTKIRRITTAKAASIALELETKSVHEVYLNQAPELDPTDDKFPRDFIKQKSVENIKTRQNRIADDPFTKLRIMRHSVDYGDSIKEISDPFGVLFWTKKQQKYYATIATEHGACISLDATGSLIRQRSLLAGIDANLEARVNLPHVFLYLISVKNPQSKSVPVGQMLSSQQDAVKINHFLNRWLLDFSVPNEVTMDDSKALLKSCTESFAKCPGGVKEYLHKCFNALNGNISYLPRVFVRLDLTHYTKNAHRNIGSKTMEPQVRQLYLAVMGYLIQCEDYSAALSIIEHMITLANVKRADTVEQSLNTLKQLVRSHDLTFIINEKDDNENTEDDEVGDDAESENEGKDTYCDPNIKEITLFEDILNRVLGNDRKNNKPKSDNVNKYYDPGLNKYFKKEVNRIPLWSAVMLPLFRSKNKFAISNDTESRFGVIKNVLFKNHNLPIRPDVFVDVMLKYVDNMSTLVQFEIRLAENILKLVSFLFIFFIFCFIPS